MCRIPTFATGILASLLLIAGAHAAKPTQPLEIGKPAPDFSLPGVDGATHSLADFGDAKVLLVVFTCNHCPTAQAYEDRLIKLHEDFDDKGVALVAISPNDPLAVRLDELGYTDVGDSLADMKIRAKERDFAFPYLFDGQAQEASKKFGVLATPHVFIFDAERNLRYQGRIDDSDVRTVKSHDTRNAIEALLAGQPVPVETTRVFGCSTKWSDKQADAKESLAKWDAEPVELEVADAALIEKLVRNETENYLLINVWSITCIPCISELPELVTINRMYRKRPFEMITVCMDPPDQREEALQSLKKHHVSSKNLIFASDDKDALAEALDAKWQGPVPYTILVAPDGEIVERWTDEIDPLRVKRAIVDRLGRTYASRKAPE